MATLLIPGVGLVPDDSALLIPGAGIVQAGAAAVTVTGTAATIAFSVGAGSIVQKQIITGTAAEWEFSTGTGVITQASGVGGKLTRRRRTRSRYWPDTELDVLVDALGRHPIERDPRTLRAEAKLGLTQVITSGQPVAVSYADDALLLDLVGQQIRVSGVLKKHVEQLIDDEDVADILHLIA